MTSDYEAVLVMSQTMIRNEMDGQFLQEVMIPEKVDQVLAMNPKWRENVDRERVIRDLETRFSIWIGSEATLVGDDDHVRWLDAERKDGRRYWPRYRQLLEAKWSSNSIDSLDQVTENVLSLLEDPRREGSWDRRGLVVGHVQSGKTSHYTGLICKAADAGYKVVIVLAGMHKNLRSQTQMRLDEGFLGYETMPPQQAQEHELRSIGVGLIDSDPALRPDYVTNRSDNGDFNRTVANSLGISPGGRPLVFVVKKHASVLLNLLHWIDRVANTREEDTGRPIVANIPLLVIDDEADLASVDTREQAFDETGQPDPEHDPTMINRRIRRILYCFQQSAYVGYTATPFASIFIHEKGATAEEGEDIFPRSFIINLPAPSDYAGPVRIFGLEPDAVFQETVDPLPLVRHVMDHAVSPDLNEREGWIPPRHLNGHTPLYHGQSEVPPSLREAIHAFVLACALRRARGQEHEHNSMLVHVTRYTVVQQAVAGQVKHVRDDLERRLLRGEGGAPETVLDDLRRLWEEDFLPTTLAIREEIDDPGIEPLSWDFVMPHLTHVVSDITVREINGTAGDVLDYDTHHATGLHVIAIGGDKLSRGLTLEGLTVSYFLRATRMYDTLMQMGRWFGYRPGYLDVCRLYMTPDLDEWFQHITEASEELRQEFDHMVAVGGTPRQYGLKVRSHPSLMVTSRVKMRHGTELQLSFSHSVSETVVFHRDAQNIERNFQTAETFLRGLGAPHEVDPERQRPGGQAHRWSKTYLWSEIGADQVMAYLDSTVTHKSAVRVNSRILREFIEQQTRQDELTDWTVVLVSGGEEGSFSIADLDVELIKRSPHPGIEDQAETGRYVIRRLLAPRDEAIDLDLDDYDIGLQQTIRNWSRDPGRSRRREQPNMPSGPSIRERRDPSNGLLLLYPLSHHGDHVEGDLPVIGFGISFPYSDNARRVTYRVNNIYSAQEFGTSR